MNQPCEFRTEDEESFNFMVFVGRLETKKPTQLTMSNLKWARLKPSET